MARKTPWFVLVASIVLISSAILVSPALAQLSNTTLFDFSDDYEGWIMQYAERYHNQSGQMEVLDYVPFDPEGWDDATHYPYLPGSDPAANGEGAFELGLHLEGVWDNVNAGHRWFDATYVQSEDWYTHNQSNWPAGYEQHPDYTGSWTYGHYGTTGSVSGDYIRVRVYEPGFAHSNDPVQAWLYTKSGAGWTWIDNGPYNLEHGWNVLRFPVSAIADPSDLREVGVKMGASHHIWGDMYLDVATLGATTLEDQRYIYLTPDVAWFSEESGYDSKTVTVYYDDGEALTPGVRGFHIVVNFPADCVQVTGVTQGTFLSGEPNHFEPAIDNVNGEVMFDWVILGATSGASGFGSLATITFAAAVGHEGDDCCDALDLDETDCRLRDPDNNPLTAVFVDGQISHDITPPADATLASSTHTEGDYSSDNDIKLEWATTADGGTCPVGMRGYYLLLDNDPSGEPDPGASDFTWFTPWSPDSADYAYWFDDVTDGTWYVHIIGYDWLWNSSNVDTYGPIYVDTTPPANVTNLDADITDNADLSVDLSWTNPGSDFAGVKIYRKGFGFYPEYDDDGGSQPPWPTDRDNAIANGWTEVYDGTASNHVDTPTVRDYYYYAAFVYDNAENYAAATADARDESLCYWLGDFTVGGSHVVDILDVLVLSSAYNTAEGDFDYNNICDIGPTVDYGRKSLPTTDNLIEFEDLVVLAMNYENETGLLAPPTAEPCTGTMQAKILLSQNDGELEARILLEGNPGCLIGASVELSYGSKLEYLGAAQGGLWSGGESFFIDAEGAGSVSLDAVALGMPVGADGCHAVARFRITDANAPDLSISIEGFRARGLGNVDLAGGTYVQDNEPATLLPATHALFGAAPNPASTGALIQYALASEERVRIRLFDASGRLVRVLVDGVHTAGHQQVSWDGLMEDGSATGPGIYFYRMQAGDYTSTRKLTVVN